MPKGKTLLEAARLLGVGIESLCGGRHVCGKCKVYIETGRSREYGIESQRENAGSWKTVEGDHITPEERANGCRLGCIATLWGDLLVHVPEESRPGKQVIGKAARAFPIDHDPAVKTYFLQLQKATLADPDGDFERTRRVLEDTWGLTGLSIDLVALRHLGRTLRAGHWEITVSVWMDREIIRVQAGKAGPHYGLAVDLGTTTIAAYLCDLHTMEVVETAAMMNPQIQYGEDVISRIDYCFNNTDGLCRLSTAVVDGLNSLIDNAVSAVKRRTGRRIDPADIEDVTLCGNTCMQHLLLQLDPEPLGSVPFTPANQSGLNIKARELGLRANPSANVYILPNIAGFVGGDTVGVILVEEPQNSADTVLIIDIGTNGELVIANKERRVCATCSCATGPALEGAQITFGVRAAPGAIERVKISPETHSVDYKVVGRDAWLSYSNPREMRVRGICGSAVLDALAELFTAGIVAASGAFIPGVETRRLRMNPNTGQKEFVLAWSAETAIGKDVVVTQNDIRQIQLAKAAIYTGCKLMLRRMNLRQPDRIKIAGAFGNHIDIPLAMVLGLFPDCPPEGISSIGNAAGDGCRMALLDRKKRAEAERIAREVEYVELTLMEDFQETLIGAIHIPHTAHHRPQAT
jgi:uncharacterized 2Fe-2S/4Fe-4S cluster protein (DUF4445 family)